MNMARSVSFLVLVGAVALGTAILARQNAGDGGTAPVMEARSSTPAYSRSGYDIRPLPPERVEELAGTLTPEEAKIILRKGTEAPFCGDLLDHKLEGVYTCRLCGLPLFSSGAKFTSGTGWPSFFRPFDEDHITEVRDESHGMVRTEILCRRCGAHLGHVFEDGPPPTGRRYCLNSASLTFYEKGGTLPEASRPVETETAYFAGGCFWGIEHYFDLGPGVLYAESGYMQGHVNKPTYKQVCYENTGHAETVKVVFDPRVITYDRLLRAFFDMHDPTQLNRQGPDVGEQYRSGIWYTTESQRRAAEDYIRKLGDSGRYGGSIVTRVEAAKTFYPAEDYHQDYIAKTGRACHVKDPW